MLRIGLFTGLLCVNSQGSDACQPKRSPEQSQSSTATGVYPLQLQAPENARQDVCMSYSMQNEGELSPERRTRQETAIALWIVDLHPQAY
jgi:hypothetical protein